jgi:hypothetical protein
MRLTPLHQLNLLQDKFKGEKVMGIILDPQITKLIFFILVSIAQQMVNIFLKFYLGIQSSFSRHFPQIQTKN